MKLGTLRTARGTVAVRVESTDAVEIDAADVGVLLQDPQWMDRAGSADGRRTPWLGLIFAPPIPRPGKIICVGLNYRAHILEMGRELPGYPTLFAKYPEALIGPYDTIELPEVSTEMDWEAELAVVIGRTVRHADHETAAAAIAGYSIINDVTARDYQYRTGQWLQGKTFQSTTPLGPYLVTSDEYTPVTDMTGEIDGVVVQQANLTDLVFDPISLVAYISVILVLNPGDIIATGTPGGVGHARTPRYIDAGSELVTRIDGLGELRNRAARATR